MDSALSVGVASLFLRDLPFRSQQGWLRLSLFKGLYHCEEEFFSLFLQSGEEKGWNQDYQCFCWSPLHCSCLDALKDTTFLVAKLLFSDFWSKISRLTSSSRSFLKGYGLISGFTNGFFHSIPPYTSQSLVVKYILKIHWNLCYSTASPFQWNCREGGEAGSGGARCSPRAKPWPGLLDILKDLKRALLH